MKEKEFQLLVQLRKDSRESLTRIGRAIGMPVSTVHDKIKRIGTDLVKKYTCILDFKKLGFNCRAHLVLRLSKKEQRAEIRQHLLQHQNVNSVYKINNGYDFLAELIFRDMSELDRFLENLDENFKIREKKVYYIIEDVTRETFISNPLYAGLLGIRGK